MTLFIYYQLKKLIQAQKIKIASKNENNLKKQRLPQKNEDDRLKNL